MAETFLERVQRIRQEAQMSRSGRDFPGEPAGRPATSPERHFLEGRRNLFPRQLEFSIVVTNGTTQEY
jgi:hypothetical protein